MNMIIIIGRLGKDPDSVGKDKVVCKFSVATDEGYMKKGEWVNGVEWHNCVAFGKMGEKCEKFKKGLLVHVVGKIKTNEWEDRSGNKRKSKEIIVNYAKAWEKVDRPGGGDVSDKSDAFPSEESEIDEENLPF